MIVIPWVQGVSWFRQDVALTGRVYRLEAQYNDAGQFWSMDLYTRDGVALLQGIKLKLGSVWGSPAWNTDEFPAGVITVLSDDPRTPCTPRFDDMGTRAQLVYVDALI